MSYTEIKKFPLSEENSYIVLASDGLWEYMNESDVHKITKRYNGGFHLDEAADKLIKESTQRWRKHNDVIDDITVILISLR